MITCISPCEVKIQACLPDAGIHPEGAGPSCSGGAGMREGGTSLSTNLNSSVDSIKPLGPSAGLLSV